MIKLFRLKLIRFMEIFVATVGYIIALLSFLSVFYINKLITDYAKGIEEITQIQFYLIVVFLVFLQMGLVFYFSNYYVQKSTLTIGGRIFNSIFDKILSITPPDFDKYNKSSILNIIFSDTFSTANMTLAAIAGILGNIVAIILACYFLYTINSDLLMISFIMFPIYFIVSLISSSLIKKKNKLLLEQNDSLMNVAKNYSENVPIIKMLAEFKIIKKSFSNTTEKLFNVDKNKSFYEILFSSIYSIFGVVAQISILFFGSKYIAYGQMTVGDLIMYSGMCGFLFEPISNISTIFQMVRSGKPNFERVNNILLSSSKSLQNYEKTFKEINYGVDVKGVVKDNIGRILYDIDLKLPATGFFILKGPNGSGKSTLFNIISGVYDLSQLDGVLYINNEFKDNISILNYPLFLIDDAIKENILLGENNIHDAIYEMDYEKVVVSNPPNVSSGEAQKIALNRILNLDRKLVLIDEPSTNLETQAIYELKNYIEREKNNRLILIITHDENYDDISDGVIEIKDKSINFGA